MDKKIWPNHILFTKYILNIIYMYIYKYYIGIKRLEIKEWKQIYMQTPSIKGSTWDNINLKDFKTRDMTRDKEGHFITIKNQLYKKIHFAGEETEAPGE